MNKKIFLAFSLLFLVIFLSGCFKKVEVNMDELAQDGKYHYRNKDLGFSLVLPAEFEYYQTQRRQTNDYVDIDFFVPTADTSYYEEVPGYAKPILVRIFIKSGWEEFTNGKSFYQNVAEKDDKVYTIRFWDEAPEDWQDKWNQDMKQAIVDGFGI